MSISAKTILFAICFLFPVLTFAQSTNGLVAHWAFNGGAFDSTGKGHNGTMSNVTPVAGKSGAANTAVRFGGSAGSIITVPYQSDLNVSNYSICAVVKPEGFYTNTCQISMLLARGNDNGSTGAYFLSLTENVFDSSCTSYDTNHYVFTCGGGPANYPYHYSWADSPTVHTNQWYCVVATFDGSAFKIYINGDLKVTAPPQSAVPIGTSMDGLSIGGTIFGNAAQYPYWYKGVMDDMRLYNRVLTPSEIAYYCTPDDGGDTVVHITNVVTDIALNIYPNPSTGSFRLQGTITAATATVEVYNMVGQPVHRNTVTPVNDVLDQHIDLSHVAEGVYFLKLAAGGESKTYRILVQR